MKALIFNIRLAKTQKACQSFHKFALWLDHRLFTCQDNKQIKNRLEMSSVLHNRNGNVWVSVNHGYDGKVVRNLDKYITIKLYTQPTSNILFGTFIYTKCDKV